MMSDPHPDSPPEADHDDRSDIERAVGGENENVERGPAPEGEPGAVGGTDGVTKNQGDDAQ